MRTLSIALLLFTTPALAQEATPTVTPSAFDPTKSPDLHGPVAPATATPVPTEPVAPVPTPAPAPREKTPGVFSRSESSAPRSGWTVELGLANQVIQDRGFDLFASGNVAAGYELRVRRDLLDGARLRFSPEIGFGLAHPRRDLGGPESELWLSRLSIGARVSFARAQLPGLRVYARGGAMGLHGTAILHDANRDHRNEAFGAGGYASVGFEADAGPLLRGSNLLFAVEGGRAYSPGLAFPRMGTLTIDGAYWSATAAVRF